MANIIKYAREHKFVSLLAIVLLVILVASLVRAMLAEQDVETSDEGREVTVASLAELSGERAPLSLVGTVQSQSEASLYAQAGGEVRRVSVKAGDKVVAGAVLAELENASERASVAQAQGSLQAAQANLLKVRAGDRPEDRATAQAGSQTAKQNLETSKKAALDATRSAYSLAEDAVRNKSDVAFSNPQSNNASLKFNLATIKYGNLEQRIESNRQEVGKTLNNWSAHLSARGTNASPEQELALARRNLEQIQAYLNDLGEGVNSTALAESEVESWRAGVSLARSALSSALSSITASTEGLDAAKLAVERADNSLSISQQGGRVEDVKAAEASVAQAQAGVQAARAQLDKTIVRTPISGTVATLSIKQGDFVGPNTLAAVVTNEGALEIETFVTAEDAAYFAQGSPVLIDSRFAGVVTNVAPGLDPITKKIKVAIGITEENAKLTHGDTVRLAITRELEESTTAQSDIRIPITALKVGTDETVVFTVSSENKLVAHSVVVGPLLGNSVQIREGLDSSMTIVLDARGLTEGEEVTVVGQ